MTNLDPHWAEAEWRRLVESRPRRNRRRRISFFILGFSVAAIAASAFLWRDRWTRWAPLTIQSIEISGNRVVPNAELVDLLELHAGDPWWRCSPRALRARVESDPRIRSLSLSYAWFHRLRVAVEERQPAMAVVGLPEGELTADGWLLPMRKVGDPEDLPILRAAPGSLPAPDSPVDRRTAQVAHLIAQLRSTRPGLWQEISEVEMTSDEARAYLRSMRGVILFMPGVHEDLWSKVPAVLDDLVRQELTDAVLDLRFDGRIIVRLPESITADSLFAGKSKERV